MARNLEVVRVPGPGAEEREFIEFPKRLYRGCPQWVPWFDVDMRALLRRRHPYFAHSIGEFFLVREAGGAPGRSPGRALGRTLGRACVVKNDNYIAQHGAACAQFYFFDVENDPQAAEALVGAVVQWARDQKLSMLRGPMLLGGVSGSGILIQGFELRASMTMMPYNYPYYAGLLEGLGFTKHVDLYSMDLPPRTFRLPERVGVAAEKTLARGRFQVLRFASKRDVRKVAQQIAGLYNDTLGDHLEDYPLSEAELKQVEKDLLLVADPTLVKILTYDGKIVGYLLAFPDLSAAMQRNGGKLGPIRILRLLREIRRAEGLLINGMGILPDHQRLGGNALLYSELTKTAGGERFQRAELTQISERTELMLRDVQTLGARIYKVHRMFEKSL